jgi:hypothetical protein
MVVIVRPHLAKPWALTAFRFGCLLVLLLTAGLPYRFPRYEPTAAGHGQGVGIRRGYRALHEALVSAAESVICFLAGPLVFAGLGWLYWLSCGESTWLDWLILAELAIVAGVYWFYALLAAGERGRLDGLHPPAVAGLAHRLGWRGLAVVLLAALVLLAHGGLVWAGAAEVQGAAFTGGAILAAAWLSALCWGGVFCRRLVLLCLATGVLRRYDPRPRSGPTRAALAPGPSSRMQFHLQCLVDPAQQVWAVWVVSEDEPTEILEAAACAEFQFRRYPGWLVKPYSHLGLLKILALYWTVVRELKLTPVDALRLKAVWFGADAALAGGGSPVLRNAITSPKPR